MDKSLKRLADTVESMLYERLGIKDNRRLGQPFPIPKTQALTWLEMLAEGENHNEVIYGGTQNGRVAHFIFRMLTKVRDLVTTLKAAEDGLNQDRRTMVDALEAHISTARQDHNYLSDRRLEEAPVKELEEIIERTQWMRLIGVTCALSWLHRNEQPDDSWRA